MPTVSFDDVLGLDDEFDPLMADDLEIDQEDMDDDNPLDTVDYPTMRNMPQSMRLCRGGCAASRVAEHVEAAQASNRSVYAPMTLCRMLERAGALTLEMPEAAEPHEDVEAGVAFLEIKERVDPVWRTTEEGSALYERLTQGSAFRDIVLDRDSRYVKVYRAVMRAVDERPCTKPEIEDLVDTFDEVKSPRRFGGHFIDMLERTDALEWSEHAWRLTDLGRAMLPAVEAAAAAKKEENHV